VEELSLLAHGQACNRCRPLRDADADAASPDVAEVARECGNRAVGLERGPLEPTYPCTKRVRPQVGHQQPSDAATLPLIDYLDRRLGYAGVAVPHVARDGDGFRSCTGKRGERDVVVAVDGTQKVKVML
jgi:hypothetical protein